MPKKENDGVAKDRILDAAEELFAQNGYAAVSVRQITAAARCNLAAVNYHFGNKKNLYLEVFRSRLVPNGKRVSQSFEDNLAARPEPALSDVIHALAQAFLEEGPLTDEERERHAQLMAREMARPIGAMEIVIDEVMRPLFESVACRLRPHLMEEIDDESLTLKILSIFAMVTHFNFARAAISRITGREYNKEFKTRLVDHISEFATKGLGMMQREDDK
ncbi:MAG: CerR family C-terminal domain-containing protein [Desulfobacterales bacterium]